MDCRNLFSAFQSIGGQLTCNFETQSCSLNKTKNCLLKPSNKFDLENLVIDYSYAKKPQTTFAHMDGVVSKKAHDLHFNLAKGFTIDKPFK